jgi:hypothetical protein
MVRPQDVVVELPAAANPADPHPPAPSPVPSRPPSPGEGEKASLMKAGSAVIPAAATAGAAGPAAPAVPAAVPHGRG